MSHEHPESSPALARLQALDTRLVAAAKGIQVLTRLAWPASLRDRFLAAWDSGRRELPRPKPPRGNFAEAVAELRRVAAEADDGHPVGRYLRRTAESYVTAAELIGAAGTKAFTEHSLRLYGGPDDPVTPGGPSTLDAAGHFVRYADAFHDTALHPVHDYCITAESVRAHLQEVVTRTFGNHPLQVVIDDDLAAKAAAGASRVRLRTGTCFTAGDGAQLAEHEVLVHALTLINGRRQPRLTSLGLGAPRTTCDQEGLATTAELVTRSMDLSRLRRLALRIRAVAAALDGADFLEVFELLLAAGETPDESFSSSMRVFRGGDPAGGGSVFTKDVVYLRGMLSVHSFLRKALEEERPELIPRLFAGRLTLGDVLELEPAFESGWIEGPRYEPEWVANRPSLGAYLVFSIFLNRVKLDVFALDGFRE